MKQRNSAAAALPTHDRPDPILAAAYATVMDIGLRRTTVTEVARRAGVSRMTVYRQYGDLETIISAVLTQEVVDLLDEVIAAGDGWSTGRERLVEMTMAATDAVPDNPLYRRILSVDPELLLPLVVDRFGSTQRAARERLTVLVREGQAEGTVRSGDPELIAGVLLVTAQSFIFSARVVAQEVASGDALSEELRILLDGYLKP